MNQRNVDALEALADALPHYSAGEVIGIANLIADYHNRRPSPGLEAPFPSPEACARAVIPLVLRLIAEGLAARGVLVPSAMTAADSIDAGEWPIERQIAALERIARGEA